MNLEDALYDSRRMVIDQVTEVVWKDKKLFAQAMDLALSNKPKIANRACRVVLFSIEKDPLLIEPYKGRIIKSLEQIKIEIVKGGFLKIFVDHELPKDDEELGILADVCFEHVQKLTKVATTKLYSMEILYKISNLEPDLKPELISIIEDQIPRSLISFKTRGKKLLKKLYKETQGRI